MLRLWSLPATFWLLVSPILNTNQTGNKPRAARPLPVSAGCELTYFFTSIQNDTNTGTAETTERIAETLAHNTLTHKLKKAGPAVRAVYSLQTETIEDFDRLWLPTRNERLVL